MAYLIPMEIHLRYLAAEVRLHRRSIHHIPFIKRRFDSLTVQDIREQCLAPFPTLCRHLKVLSERFYRMRYKRHRRSIDRPVFSTLRAHADGVGAIRQQIGKPVRSLCGRECRYATLLIGQLYQIGLRLSFPCSDRGGGRQDVCREGRRLLTRPQRLNRNLIYTEHIAPCVDAAECNIMPGDTLQRIGELAVILRSLRV